MLNQRGGRATDSGEPPNVPTFMAKRGRSKEIRRIHIRATLLQHNDLSAFLMFTRDEPVHA